jgi:hypothetical protein
MGSFSFRERIADNIAQRCEGFDASTCEGAGGLYCGNESQHAFVKNIVEKNDPAATTNIRIEVRSSQIFYQRMVLIQITLITI